MTNVFLGIIAFAVLVMAVIQVAAIMFAIAAARRIGQVAERIEQGVWSLHQQRVGEHGPFVLGGPAGDLNLNGAGAAAGVVVLNGDSAELFRLTESLRERKGRREKEKSSEEGDSDHGAASGENPGDCICRSYLATEIFQMRLPPSSETSRLPSRATVTPTGRPHV